MTPDHEAAKKLAKALIEAGCQGEHHANLVNAYLDLVAREQRAVELLREVERIGNANPRATNLIRAFLAERCEG